MKVFAVALALSVMLAAAPTYAQAPATQKPAEPAPQQAAPPAVKFQDGLKYAYVRIDMIAANSAEGKALAARAKGLEEQKVKELNEKNKALQAAQDKLEKGGGVMSDQARLQLQTEIERMQRDIQRSTEDAQQDFQQLTQQLQNEFLQKLLPVIEKVATAKGVHFVFNAAESGLIWADPSLDLTGDVITAFDASSKAAPAGK